MLTKEQIKALKDNVMTLDYQGGLWVTAEDYEALHQQLADAQAAQALVVERAAAIVEDIDIPARWLKARAIRTLADPSGVEELAKLRERAEKAEQERVAEWNRKRDADGSRDAARAACDSMRAERDDALARLAAAEAQVGALREALDAMRKRAVSTRGEQAYRELPAFILNAVRAALATAQGVKHD